MVPLLLIEPPVIFSVLEFMPSLRVVFSEPLPKSIMRTLPCDTSSPEPGVAFKTVVVPLFVAPLGELLAAVGSTSAKAESGVTNDDTRKDRELSIDTNLGAGVLDMRCIFFIGWIFSQRSADNVFEHFLGRWHGITYGG